jgi:tRNA (mo5U34)-methyltransferase
MGRPDTPQGTTAATTTSNSTAEPCPSDLDTQTLLQSVPYWHQGWEIFQGVFTPGRNSVETMLGNSQVPLDLSGKRVLDVGAFNCCSAFECERRGAAEVVALDLQEPEELGFPVLKEALRSRRVRFVQGSVYDLDPDQLGTFDVILFFGVLYHLRYPLLAIDQLRRVARGTIYVESLVIDQRFLADGKDFQSIASYHEVLTQVPLWQFYKANELADDYSNWFGPNIQAVLQGFESAGFAASLIQTWGDRASFQAVVGGAGTMGRSYEGVSDIVRKKLALDVSVLGF